ncbi:hypothetical protein NDU88_006805 [Pleurodeles waltl]|uniref:Uncharacterized protein n=1 Tax=Pleurodeles waltl TaxID=8319 RepID=A0AAV7TXV7_PLEWA|nr:hypothetical protein NDU88_006805 [Pleurodeles waltl]
MGEASGTNRTWEILCRETGQQTPALRQRQRGSGAQTKRLVNFNSKVKYTAAEALYGMAPSARVWPGDVSEAPGNTDLLPF